MESAVSRKPVLAFDTSGINQLTAETDFTALAAGITTAYHTRLTGSNIVELVATQNSKSRTKLLDTCQRLLASGDCIDPFNWIVEKHTKAFDENRTQYDWTKINVRSRAIEREIIARTLIDDALAREEKKSGSEIKESFENIFESMRPGFDEAFARGTERPSTFAEFIARLQKPGGAFWTGYGDMFYARNVATKPDETTVREFAGRCPPFLTMVLAAAMAQYQRAVVEAPRKKKRAGRVDLLMSVYLPYCRLFVTHDGDQPARLREVAAAANLTCEVLTYVDFRGRLLR